MSNASYTPGAYYDSDETPVYTLGEVISREKCGEPADSTDIVWSKKFEPFAALKKDGEIAVGIPAQYMMESAHVLETAIVVFGPNAEDVEEVKRGDIFYLACELKFPKGYGIRANEKKGRVRFSLSQIVKKYWAALDAKPAEQD